MCRKQPRHLRIEIDERHALDAGIPENLAHGESIASAEHEHPPCTGQRREAGVNERLVIAVLVARAELQVRIEEESQVILPSGEHDVLIARVAREDHVVRVDVVFGERRDGLRLRHTDGENRQHGDACRS